MSHERSARSRIPSYSPNVSSNSSSEQPQSGHLPPTSSSRKTSSWHPGQVESGDCMRDVIIAPVLSCCAIFNPERVKRLWYGGLFLVLIGGADKRITPC